MILIIFAMLLFKENAKGCSISESNSREEKLQIYNKSTMDCTIQNAKFAEYEKKESFYGACW